VSSPLAPRPSQDDVIEACVAAERAELIRTAIPHARFDPEPGAILSWRGETDRLEPGEATRAIVRGWMEVLGPTTAPALARRLGLRAGDVEIALAALERDGVVLRGRFTPDAGDAPVEWCERRLLSRIHRLTLGRLRREIEAVSTADFVRFLLRWQHVAPRTQLHGRAGIAQVIGQLQGLELPAPAWERDVLPARIAFYNPDDLEALCLSGEVAWGRLRMLREVTEDAGTGGARARRPGAGGPRGRRGPTRAAPLAFALRADLPCLLEPGPAGLALVKGLSAVARDVLAHLERRGASFLPDIARATGWLVPHVEEALWELVSRGLVTGDGIAGLRLLLAPQETRRLPHRRLRAIRGARLGDRPIPVGRWSLLRQEEASRASQDEVVEALARQMLRRYGVVVRELLARESRAPSWRELVSVYRRLEDRGEIRGGRFVAGLVGEQFALPEAVEALRAVRRKPDERETVVVSAADPLNLLGILFPGPRLPPFSGRAIAYRAGIPIATGDLASILAHLRSVPSQA
jgi:ATP-dependent Lhr-like helicase